MKCFRRSQKGKQPLMLDDEKALPSCVRIVSSPLKQTTADTERLVRSTERQREAREERVASGDVVGAEYTEARRKEHATSLVSPNAEDKPASFARSLKFME